MYAAGNTAFMVLKRGSFDLFSAQGMSFKL